MLALLTAPGAFLVGLAAAWLLTEGSIPLPDPVIVGVRSGRAGENRRQLDLDDDELTQHLGLPCTSADRTCADVLRLEKRWQAIAAVDAITHLCLTVPAFVAVALDRRPRQRGLTVARPRLAEVDANAASRQETYLRLTITDGGLARPTAQMLIFSRLGEFLGRSDLGYEELLLALEYLGDVHSELLAEDAARHRAMAAEDVLVLPFTKQDLWTPGQVVGAVTRGAASQRRRLGLTTPRLPSSPTIME